MTNEPTEADANEVDFSDEHASTDVSAADEDETDRDDSSDSEKIHGGTAYESAPTTIEGS